MLSRLDVEEDDHLARVQGPVYGADLGHRDPHDEVEDGCVHPEVNCDEVRREAGPARQRAEERGRHALCKEEGAAGRSEGQGEQGIKNPRAKERIAKEYYKEVPKKAFGEAFGEGSFSAKAS